MKPPAYARSDLAAIAVHTMIERGLQPDFPDAALRQLETIAAAGPQRPPGVRDLTAMPWCSIDNDDSRDLDQLTVCTQEPQGAVRILVAIADVDALVAKDSPIDAHARLNTTSVYTGARIFPMLPERLSTDLSSLNAHEERLAVVTDMVFDADGSMRDSTVYRARVRNHAKLAYDSVAEWLEGRGPLPAAAAAVPDMDAQLRTQDGVAQQLRARRHEQGALEFETLQPRAVFDGDRVVDIRQQAHNRARQLIEEFMIATNGCTARFLAAHGRYALRRVVRSPERWQRIVEVAQEKGDALPATPDGPALHAFLARQRAADPLRFPDLSLVIVKLMGAGEYVLETPGSAPVGHFGLATRDYMHSTAPNRRFPDLITERLLKALLEERPSPYSMLELRGLAAHCTEQEDNAKKVERKLRKCEAALLLAPRIGERFDGVVTGSSAKGVWVRIFAPPAEGKLLGDSAGFRVGEKLQVRLSGADVERGFIDFTPD